MEAQEPLAQGWAIAVLVTLIPLGLFLFFKMMTAKTRKAHWGYFALVMFLATILLSVLGASGLMPSAEQMRQHQVKSPSPGKALANLPAPALVTLGLAAVIWFGGGNWILIRQRRKAGRSWWECLNPFNPPFRDMDRRSWLQLILLALFGVVVISVGLELTMPAVQPAASISPPS